MIDWYSHIVVSSPKYTSGNSLKATSTVSDDEQPLSSVTKTIYSPTSETLIVCEDSPELHK